MNKTEIWSTTRIANRAIAQRAVLRERGCMPARTFVRICKCVARPSLCAPPRPRKAAGSLYAICGQCVGQEIITINPDKITKNFKSRKTKYFAKLVLSCSLRSHHKTNPTPKMATPYLALPTHHPKQETLNRILLKTFFFFCRIIQLLFLFLHIIVKNKNKCMQQVIS